MYLQQFAQEKTERATPRRREQAHKRGQVFRSVEVGSALLLLGLFLVINLSGPGAYRDIRNLTVGLLGRFRVEEWTAGRVDALLVSVGLLGMKILAPILLTALLIGVAADLAQVGFLFSFEPIKPNFARLDPIAGFQRMFSKRSLVELAKALLKVTVVGWVCYSAIRKEIDLFPLLVDMEIGETVRLLGGLTLGVAWKSGAALLILAAADYAYQRWEYEAGLRMSKQEIKEEMKETEGNPQIRQRIRERQRAMARRRMMQDVAKADVVVTNPTNYAVALKYDLESMTAPQVVAKGQGFLAARIKEVAAEHRVAVVENKPLARALYSSVEVGGTIPAELYQAVAEVLAFVYRLKGKA